MRWLAALVSLLLVASSALALPPPAHAEPSTSGSGSGSGSAAEEREHAAEEEGAPADPSPAAPTDVTEQDGVVSLLSEDDATSTQVDDPAQETADLPADADATVEADVTEALAGDDTEVGVIIHLHAQADLPAVAAEAAREARSAAQQARERARARGESAREVAGMAREAAHAARTTVVVEHLQDVASRHNTDVRSLLEQRADQGRVHDLREYWIFNGFAATVDSATLDELAIHPDVERITLDRVLEVPETEEGPRLPTWSLEAVNAPNTWGEYGIRGQDVVVGVLDTGVDGEHPALAGTYRGRDGDHATSWYVPTGENYPTPGDGHGHGTHVTGSITGGPPGEVIGVAPEAEWIGVKIFTDAGSTSESIIRDGMQWVLAPDGDPTKAPHVVNNSWGHPDAGNIAYWDEVEAWVAAGIFPVFANGNAGPLSGTVGSPASFPHSLGVGATDRDDIIADFSSRGPAFWDGERFLKPEVSAPGHQVFSAWPQHTGQDYHTISGTSMAAPHVAGVAALALSAASDLTVDELRDTLTDTVRTEPHMGGLPNDSYGHGIVDAFAATTRVMFAGTLAGTITDADGPVEATVSIPDEDLATTSDPETGAYSLFVLEGTHDVTVEAYGYVTHEATVTIEAGEVTTLDVELELAEVATLSGTVTGDGVPLEGATVTLPDTPLDAVTTDEDGAFALEVAHGSYEVRATAHGFLPGSAYVTIDGDTNVTLDLDALVQDSDPGWAQYQNNPARTGFTEERAAPETFVEQWTTEVAGSVMFSSPVIADGRVFLTTDNGRLHVLDAEDGSSLWSFATGGTLRSTPHVTDDAVYLGGGDDATLYALDQNDGEVRWTYSTGDERLTYATPTEVDGTVYVSTGFGPGNGGFVHAVDAQSGEQVWRSEVGPQIFFGPAVADGAVIAASRDTNRIAAFDADTGEELWSHVHDETFISMPTVTDGVMYIGTSTVDFTSGSVLALDATTGDVLWHTTGHGDSQGNTPVVYGDLVILGSHSHSTVSAYDRTTGERVWTQGIGAPVTSAQLVTAGGVLLGGSQGQAVFALDAATGTPLWDHDMPDNVLSSPATADALTVFADRRGNITAFASTGTISGTITGPDGPLEATVRVPETGQETTTDPDTGAFEFAHRPGSFTVEVRAYGYEQHDLDVDVEVARVTRLDLQLAAVGDGTVTGTITDEDGAPLEGAEVVLSDTPLDPAVTGADGTFTFPGVAAGTYPYLVDADGYAPQEGEVEVRAGETTVLDAALVPFDVAVVSDLGSAITDILRDAGWLVDRVTFADIDGNVDRYQAVVLSGERDDRADADLDRLARIVDDADDAGTSLLLLDQWSLAYGALRPVAGVTGDPGSVTVEGQNRGRVWLEDVVEHPITASLPDEPRVQLLTGGDHAWFDDYSGLTLAQLGTDQTGPRGGGLGYERRSFTSSHVLLPVHAPTPWAGPELNWQPAMTDLLLDAVDHAITAEYGAVAGTVTDTQDDPLDAVVEVVDGPERTRADEDGGYRLLLDPGEYTLRFRATGFETVEEDVTVGAGETLDLDVVLSASGLGTLTGTVTDEATDAPIAGVTVTVEDLDLPPATTDGDGIYTIDAVPGGTYDVSFEADGYLPTTIEDVEVVEGEVTTLDIGLESAPTVAVVGDRFGQITDFLNDRSIPAFEAGWEITADLDAVDVVVLHHPSSVDQETFLAHLDAFDDAAVSVIFPSDGWSFRTRGIHLLSDHTGDPADIGRIGGFRGPEIFLHDLADHPIFAGIDDDPVQILTAASEAGYFIDYSGVPLAQVAEEGADPAGVGVAFNPRTADSVHLLLSGLAATFRNHPEDDWTPAGQRIFLNAVRWAAAPQLGVFSGTVTDTDDEPITHATVEVVDTPWSVTTEEDGAFEIGVPAGSHTLRYEAFGYVGDERELSVDAGRATDASIELEVGDVGTIEGTVRSRGDVDPDASPQSTLEGVEIELVGTPLTTTTDADGTYRFDRVEPGSYELLLEVDGHVRAYADIEVSVDETTQRDVELRPSPRVGIIDDSDFTNSRDRGKQFLEHWGYRAEDIDWDDLDTIRELDLVVVNISHFTDRDPGPDGFAAFEDVVNRAGIPVLWMGQHGRGGIEFLEAYTGDPGERGEGWRDGEVVATVVEDHPLVAGLPDSFELIEPDGRYSWFDDFGGTTVAELSTTDHGHMGDTIGFKGRTSRTVDVLASTLTVTTWGAPSTAEHPALRWTPEAERVYVNALDWALDAEGLGAEVRGTVQDETGARIPSTVEVLETGRTFEGREGDGTFVVPLEPGSWTLEISSFAHLPTTYEVTVEAGVVDRPTITLEAAAAGDIVGQVTDEADLPIEGATVRALDSPRVTETDADGNYELTRLPEGEWTLEFRASGFQAKRVDVTVEDDTAHTVDVILEESNLVAVAGDRQDAITGFLEDESYEVDTYAYAALDDITDTIGDYQVVVLNGIGTAPSADTFTTFLDAAADADVSVIFASQWGSGSIRHLSQYLGDPEDVTQGFEPEEIAYTVLDEHPIFDGYDVGETVTILENEPNQQFMYFSGYSGTTIARTDAPAVDEQLGDGLAFRFVSPQSAHVLLGNLAASFYGDPDNRWTEDARQIYLNAVAWAVEAAQGEVFGQITSDGDPLEGATVTAIEVDASTRTDEDGTYRLGLPDGTHTIEASKEGYAPASTTITVGEGESEQVDLDLQRLDRGSLEVVVTDAAGDDEPIADAAVTVTGPMEAEGTTDEDGRLVVDDLVEGDYEVEVSATGYLGASIEATVVPEETTVAEIALAANDVAVLGDVDELLTDLLRDADVPAEARTWEDLAEDLGAYRVLIANGGAPTEEEFTAVLEAADEAGASVILTGSWGVDRGGIRLLEAFTDDVTVGGHGYGDGPVGLTGLDPEHPLFEELDTPDSRLVADDGYYSWLGDYVGHHLADLTVDDEVAGLSIGYDFRGVDHVHLLLSAAAVTDVMGPGYGWTEETAQLVLSAIAWVREVEQPLPATPTLTTDADELIATPTITVEGESEHRTTVTIERDGEVIAATEPDRDGSYTTEIELVEGENELVAVATNFAGSATSEPLAIWLDTTGPVLEWIPEDGEGFLDPVVTVAGTAHDEPAGVDEVSVNGTVVDVEADGAWSTEVTVAEEGTDITVRAVDTLGNETVETRTVAYVPLEVEWEVPPRPARAINVRLHVTDLDDEPTEVDAAWLEAIAEDDEVHGPYAMRWSDDRYHHVLTRLPHGPYDLVGRLEVDDWIVTVHGPTVRVR